VYPSRIRLAIENYLEDRPNEVAFLRSEFNGCGGSRSGVDKALRAMLDDGILISGGYGVYVRASRRRSTLTGNIITAPNVLPERWVRDALLKLGVNPTTDSATREYGKGKTTQVPTWLAFDVGSSRIKRTLRDRGRTVVYERS
jgi:hypothetical protein